MAMASWELQSPLNINISAYRVLYILLLLVQHRSLNMMELNQYLYDNPLIQRVYNSETLTKYVNTLRRVGCRIPRSSNRNDYNYELLENPFPLSLTEADVAIARKLMQALSVQPDERLGEGYGRFLEKVVWAIGNQPGASPVEPEAPQLPETQETNPSGNGEDSRRALLSRYRQYCDEAFLLEVQYQGGRENTGGSRVMTLMLEPHEVLEKRGKLFLLGLEQRTYEKKMLNLNRIVGVRQLPSKMKRGISEMTVRFELYGRLAESYRPYADEKIIFRTSGRIQVKAQVRETSSLISRLMKYGPACQVLSPAMVRDAMRERIAVMQASLSEQPEPTD